MADIADKANDAAALWTKRCLGDHERRNRRDPLVSFTHCVECGGRISEARRQTVIGCRFCVECQKYVDDGK